MTPTHPSLKNLLGAGYCDDAAARESMAAQGVVPACICSPQNGNEAAALVTLAAQRKLPLVPYGSGTQQGSGRPPVANFVALSTRRINQIVHHEPGDMVASVQAGMELGALQTALGARGQWLPLDGHPRSTIGGLVAADYSGPLAYGYGTLRDRVLGMSIVHGDGVLRKCGGKVVKNVTGYALEKLYIGSMGTLGLITEVTFKLQPLPVGRAVWKTEFGSGRAAAFALLSAVHARNLPLERLELSLGEGGIALTAQAAGTAKELARIDAELRIDDAGFARSDSSTAWSPAEIRERPPPSLTLRFWSLHSLLEAVYKAVAAVHAPVLVRLSGQGGRFELDWIDAAQFAQLAAAITALGANYRCENIRGLRLDAPCGPPRPDVALMRKIKTALDPQDIFNTGRFMV